MDPEEMMIGISKEVLATLNAMAKAKTLDEKLAYSETIKNLCDSLGVFLNLMSDMAQFEDDGERIPF